MLGCAQESPPEQVAPENAPLCLTAAGPRAWPSPLHSVHHKASRDATPSRKPSNPTPGDRAPLVAPWAVLVRERRPGTVPTPRDKGHWEWHGAQGTGQNNLHCSHTLRGRGYARRCWPSRGTGTHQGTPWVTGDMGKGHSCFPRRRSSWILRTEAGRNHCHHGLSSTRGQKLVLA